jgi:phospholipid/cholesterol/gamma-HCH transport system ATP-binding protein
VIIKVKNLQKSSGERKILNNVSFEINTSEIVFILGQSGTGKSVLLKCLVGLLKPDQGEIWIDGVEVTHFSEEQMLDVRKKCGMVFQQPALFDSLTIQQNLEFGLKRHFQLSQAERLLRCEKAIQAVHLDQKVLSLKPFDLSYGMQKRASLARTLVLEPQILLFDEPTTGLDPVATTAINNLIQEVSFQFKTTSLVVSHDMKCAVDIANRVIFLQKGEKIFDGPILEVRNTEVELVKDFFEEVRGS